MGQGRLGEGAPFWVDLAKRKLSWEQTLRALRKPGRARKKKGREGTIKSALSKL